MGPVALPRIWPKIQCCTLPWGLLLYDTPVLKPLGLYSPQIQSPLPGQAQQEWGWHHGFSPLSTPEREGRCFQEPNPSATSLLWQKVLLDITPITPRFPGPLQAGDIPVGLPGFSSQSCMDVDGSTAKCTQCYFPGPCRVWESLLDPWGSLLHPCSASTDQCQPLLLGIQGKDGLFPSVAISCMFTELLSWLEGIY